MSVTARPEIFISATSQDLGSCRQVVRDALLTMGCVPVLQDHFSLEAGNVREMLRTKIEACDAVLHLAGECYGEEPSKHDADKPRRSYTQLEYDIAREQKKPLYIFLCTDGFPYDAHEPEPEERRRLQQLHRTELTARDDLYWPVNDAHDLALRVRELQTRLEHVTRDLKKARSWLGRGVAAALVVLTLIVGALWIEHQRAKQTEQRVTQVSSELQRYREAVKAVADHYGQDFEASGRRFSAQEKFDRALAAVAEQQKINIDELKTWMEIFITQVRANPGADLYDRALADFAQRHFAEAATNATKSAEQYRTEREAAEKEAASAGARAGHAADMERRSWTLSGDAELAAGHYPAAIEPYRNAFKLTDQSKEPLIWCDAAQKLEVALQRQGLYAEAGPLARQLVDKRRALQGSEHPATLAAATNLALVLADLGDLAEAEPIYRRTLESLQRTLGRQHFETLRCSIDFAGLLFKQHRLGEAESVYRRTLDGLERTLGKDHMFTLGCLGGLAGVMAYEDKYAEAVSLYGRAADGLERTLGADHPLTLWSISCLAAVLRDKGDFVGAEPLSRRALEARERLLGKENHGTLTSAITLGTILREEGKYAEAQAMYSGALEPLERTLGPEHPETLRCVYNLAQVLSDQRQYNKAEPLFRRALDGRRRKLGKDDLDTQYCTINLAELLRSTRRFTEAECLCRDALAVLERTKTGERATLECMEDLANVLRDKGDDVAAGALYRQALEGQERILGKAHPDTAETAYNFSLLQKKDGRLTEAQTLAEEAVQGADATLPDSHPNRRKYQQLLQGLASLAKAH